MFTGNSSCTHKCYTDDKAAVERNKAAVLRDSFKGLFFMPFWVCHVAPL